MDRFWAKVSKTETCWLWTASTRRGYGSFWNPAVGKTVYAHRLAYELEYGPIPPGLVIDHQCHVTRCVNPEHLRAVENKANGENRRGANPQSRSGVRGVTWNERDKRWQGHVKHYGKNYSTPYFIDRADAERATVELRERLYAA